MVLSQLRAPEILGVPVVVPADQRNGDAAFAKITAALDLLHDHGSRSLDDLRRHTNGVFVWATAGALGEWHRDTRLVVLEETHVNDQGTSARDIASTLVHESTHARLDAKGFTYSPERQRESRKYAFAGSSPLRDGFQKAATWSVKRSDSSAPARRLHSSSVASARSREANLTWCRQVAGSRDRVGHSASRRLAAAMKGDRHAPLYQAPGPCPECLQNVGRLRETAENPSEAWKNRKSLRIKPLSPEVARHHHLENTR